MREKEVFSNPARRYGVKFGAPPYPMRQEILEGLKGKHFKSLEEVHGVIVEIIVPYLEKRQLDWSLRDIMYWLIKCRIIVPFSGIIGPQA